MNFSALKAAVPAQLYASFQTEAGNDLNVAEIWSSWAIQPGYPILNITVAPNRKHVTISQKRFLQNNRNPQTKSVWKIPLTYASNNQNSNFSYTKPLAMLSDESMEIELEEPIDWIIFNVQQTGKGFSIR